jgi:hypothetical protein
MPAPETVKMSSGERRRIALAALADAARFWTEPKSDTEVGGWRLTQKFTVDDSGEMRVEYGIGDKFALGRGAFTYYPLPAIEEAAEEIARVFDSLVVHETGQTGVGRLGDFAPAEWRQWTIVTMVHSFAIVYVGHLFGSLLDALRGAYLDAAEYIQLGLRSILADSFERYELQLEKPDTIAVRKRLINEATQRHRARLDDLLKTWKRIAPHPVGRPKGSRVTTEKVRDILRRHGRVSAATVAGFLDREESAVTRWAKGTKWKTWSVARDALLKVGKK